MLTFFTQTLELDIRCVINPGLPCVCCPVAVARWICVFFYSVYLVSYAFKSLLLGVIDLTIAVVS